MSHLQEECKLHLHRGSPHLQWASETHHNPNKSQQNDQIQCQQLRVSRHRFLPLQDRILQLYRRPSQSQTVHSHHKEAPVSIVATSRAQTTMQLDSLANRFLQPILDGWPTSLLILFPA